MNQPRAYDVSYGKFHHDSRKIKWARLNGVVEDDLLPSGSHRVFVTAQDERYEIPVQDMVFLFSRDRQLAIRERREAETKPNAPTRN